MKGVIRGMGAGTTYWIDGLQVTKDEFDTRMDAARPKVSLPDRPRVHCSAYHRPVPSEALGVHPDQVPEAHVDAMKKGVPTDFTRDGRPLFNSRQHRNRYLRAYGYYDRDAGYGDPANGSLRR